MTTYNDVFTSILAMDSYHRNNNQGVFLNGAGSSDDADIKFGDMKIRGHDVKYKINS